MQKSKKILLIDDEVSILKLTMFRLQKMGYEVFSSETGEEGCEIAKKIMPDLAIVDLKLPDIGGVDVCKRIREIEEVKNISIILMTASTEDLENVFKNSTADAYVIKPFESKTLIMNIEKLI
ncbi:MAG: response regulator [Candidatus Theseobacter exili]|nr:response regulator [Candidatus Theseobacter exili]